MDRNTTVPLNTAPADEAQLRRASAMLGVPFVRLVGQTIPRSVLELIPEAVARESGMVAYEEETLDSGRHIVRIAVADPASLEHEAPTPVMELHARKGLVIEVALAPRADVTEVLKQYLHSDPVHTSTSVAATKPKPAKEGKVSGEDTHSGQNQHKTPPKKDLPEVDLTNKLIPKDILERIPQETAEKYQVIVFAISPDGRRLQIALAQPDNPQVQDFLSFIRERTHLQIDLFRTTSASIQACLAQYQPLSEKSQESVKPQAKSKESPTSHQRAPLSFDHAKPKKNLAAILKAEQPVATPAPVLPVPAVETQELSGQQNNLLVPKAEANLLIPLNADVERDLSAVVGQSIKNVDDLETVIRTGFIPKIVGGIVLLAAKMAASDIHLQADDKALLVRFRIDGLLSDIVKMPESLQAPIVSRIKILAKLKIDEQRIPQDGRFDVVADDKQIDLRVSTFPTVKGEKVVIRLLDKSSGILKLEELGYVGSRLERIRKEITKPYGVILATGPTGSGKSTTLYAIIQEIMQPEINIVTLEDPVEYEIPGINQAQIKPKIGFGFGDGLRSILRQDPNVIMVGEIRDLETASMVTHAALTGHLVLSTLHTNDASGALPRLVNMGVEPFLITSAMNAVVAQRLVRRLCDKCRAPWQPSPEIIKQVGETLRAGKDPELLEAAGKDLTFWKAVGCDVCHDGYKGRIGIFEVLVMSPAIEDLVIKKTSSSEIVELAIAEGMVTLEQDGMLKVLTGETTLNEVLRVTKTE